VRNIQDALRDLEKVFTYYKELLLEAYEMGKQDCIEQIDEFVKTNANNKFEELNQEDETQEKKEELLKFFKDNKKIGVDAEMLRTLFGKGGPQRLGGLAATGQIKKQGDRWFLIKK
jgi:hypothetical protein